MPTSNISKKLAAEKALAVDLATELTGSEKDDIKLAIAIAETDKRIEENAISESNRNMIFQRIVVDMFNTVERYVELTPSMCRVRDCGWDAAKELGKDYGISDWNNLPLEYVLPRGKTVGEVAVEKREYHEATAHTTDALSHIITEGELRRRQETQSHVFSVPSGSYLTGAR